MQQARYLPPLSDSQRSEVGGECNKIVVVGASAGGIEAVAQILADVPPDIGAAFFVVLHLNASVPSMLASILARKTRLRVVPAEDGMEIRCGTVFTATPDHHLLVDGGVARLGRGARENNFRPAVDPLFRTAAATYGRDVIGIILSGNLDDGTAGLRDIKKKGGIAIAQSEDDAMYPGMPASAIQEVRNIDYVLPAARIGALLVEIVGVSSSGARLHPGKTTLPDIYGR